MQYILEFLTLHVSLYVYRQHRNLSFDSWELLKIDKQRRIYLSISLGYYRNIMFNSRFVRTSRTLTESQTSVLGRVHCLFKYTVFQIELLLPHMFRKPTHYSKIHITLTCVTRFSVLIFTVYLLLILYRCINPILKGKFPALWHFLFSSPREIVERLKF